MMLPRRLRHRRSLAIAAAAAALAGGGSTLALAAGDDPAPPPAKPLAAAAEQALRADAPPGVSARVEVRSELPGGVDAGPASSMLAGGTGRLWAADGHLRVDLRARGGDRLRVVARGRGFWAYQSRTKRVFRGQLPAATGGTAARRPSAAAIGRLIGVMRRHATLSRAVPGVVAGRPAYTVRVAPRRARAMGHGTFSWDADHGVPLRATLYAAGADTPLVDVKASDVSLAPVPDSVWDVRPPAGARVTALPRHP